MSSQLGGGWFMWDDAVVGRWRDCTDAFLALLRVGMKGIVALVTY